MKVIKRDGQIVEFDRQKIENAITKANNDVPRAKRMSHIDIRFVTDVVVHAIRSMDADEVNIETIQDEVEKGLTILNYDVAKSYILYREKRNMVRDAKKTDEDILSLIHGTNKEMEEENSNKNTVLNSTQRDYTAGIVSRDITARLLLPEYIRKAHEDGVLHFHDMDYFIHPMFNCCLINIGDMLKNGTVMNGKMIESPKTFRVTCTVVTQIIACIASNQYGGQSVDVKHLGKYLRKSIDKFKKAGFSGDRLDYLIKEELSAGVQTIQYQINTLMTTNGQSPFVTLFLHIDESDPYCAETAMIVEEILKQRHQGIKNEAGVFITPAFPKLVYVLDENNCLNGGKYDYITELAVRCSAKRMYPDYISAKKMRETYEGNVFSPMGCRSFLSPWKDEKGNYKFEGRFNQGVVSINLPQIGIICKGDMQRFWKELDERCELCREALMIRHKALLGVKSDVSPLHWQYGGIARLQKGETIDKLLYGGYSSISLGYIGLYELTKLMTGKSHTQEPQFALEVIKFLRSKVDEWKKETNIGFALYGTPAESLCYRFAEIDKKRFGVIEDVTDKGYYTNSYHVDVREKMDAFEKFRFEAQFQPLSSGGCISYVEIPNMNHNLDAMRDVVKFIYDNIQYAEFNTKSDYCHVCGWDGEIIINDDNQWECPVCHNKDKSKMSVTRRTCGYLGENYWNEGKTKEIKARVLHL